MERRDFGFNKAQRVCPLGRCDALWQGPGPRNTFARLAGIGSSARGPVHQEIRSMARREPGTFSAGATMRATAGHVAATERFSLRTFGRLALIDSSGSEDSSLAT